MDYTKFLGKKDEVVLAYLGGPFVYAKGRRVRLADGPRPSFGFHRFEIKGREARALEAVDSSDSDLDELPKLRGHHVRGWVTKSELRDLRERVSGLERVQLMPGEEPPALSIVRARRWHSGDLVFESLDFDTEAEEGARARLESLEPLGDLKGVPASLRIAFGVAFMLAVAERARVPLSVREAAAAGPDIAERGQAAARAFLDDLEARRAAESEQARIRAIALGRPVPRRPSRDLRSDPTLDNAALRAEIALDGAHARMLSTRNLGDGNLEVRFEFMGERFISVVDAITLNVYDSGVCLAGSDELVTLDSLPGVIREAIETDRLVITRR